MRVHFGKQKGKLVEELVIKNPDYVSWVLSVPNPTWALAALRDEAQRLIQLFDAKPFIRQCQGEGCANLACRLSVYVDNTSELMWWCAECNPYQMGANGGRLFMVSTYHGALGHIRNICGNHKASMIELIRGLAAVKGLPSRSGEKQLMEFFGA
jgi:hypothetical protein